MIRREKPLRTTLHRRRSRWRAALGLVTLALFVAVGAGIVAFAMQGPVSVPALARMIEDRVSRDEVRLTIGAATLDVSGGFPARLELENAAVEVAGESPLTLTLPRIVVPLTLSSALAGGADLNEVVLEQPRLDLQPGGAGLDGIPDMADLGQAADRIARLALTQLSDRGVERIEMRSGEILARSGQTYRVSGIDAEVTREGADTLRVEADVAGRVGRWEATAIRRIDAETGDRRIALDVRDITLGEFLPSETRMRAGRGLGVPARARMDLVLDAEGAFRSNTLGFLVSPGWVNTGKTVVSFDRIDLQLQWEADRPGFRIAPSSYLRGNTAIPIEGIVEPPRDWQEMWSYRIVSRDALLGPSDVPGPPFAMNNLLLEGRADPAARELHFDRIALRAGTATIDGAGSLRLAEDGPYLALAMESGAMPVATLKRLWPITVVPPARDWVIEHMLDGRILGGRATLALQPPVFDVDDPRPGWSGDDISVAIDFDNVSLKTLGTVPVAQAVSGRLTVADEILTVVSSGGAMIARAGEQIALEAGRFAIPDLRKPGIKTGELDLTLSGPAPSLAEVLDAEPFGVLTRNGIAPDDVSGAGTLSLDAAFELVKDVRIEDVDWRLTGRLTNFSSDAPIRGHGIARADLDVEADATRLVLNGRGRLDGLPADLDLVVPLGEGGDDAVVARQGVVIDATAEQLAARGIDLRPFVSGTLRLSSSEAGSEGPSDGQVYDIDLGRARIDLPQVGWSKAPGVPASASFTLRERDGLREVRGFRLTSEGVDIGGSLTLGADGDLLSASLSRFALRPSDDATLRVERRSGGYEVDLRARSFDGRGLMSSLSGGGDEGSAGDVGRLRIRADIDRMTGFNGVSVTDLNLRMTRAGGRLQDFALSGRTGGRDAFDLAMTGEGRGREVSGTIQDTGALLRFANLYERMRGGLGVLIVSMPEATSWTGTFKVRRLAITEDPAIRALAEAPVRTTPQRRQRETLTGSVKRGEASFSALDLAFERRGDLLTITEGTLSGASVGGTVAGQVNLKTRTLDMTGTFVPIFALNNLFAKIPILGFALGGGTDEGLIGVTYRLSGLISDPVLTVNPASAIAPGIFRKMFEYR